MEEIWRDIKGYEGYYMVSNLGRVKSLDRYILKSNGRKEFNKGKIKTLSYNKRTNVYEVHLKRDGKRKCMKIHRLVAEAFIINDDPVNKTTVNHIDGDRSNNMLNNLEWASYSENLKHAYDVLKRPINSTKIKKRPCYSIDTLGNIEEYDSIAQASRKTNISETQIRRLIGKECVNNKYEFYLS